MKIPLTLLGALAAIYALAVLAAWALQDRLLFFPSPLAESARARLKHLELRLDHAGTVLHGWLFHRDGADGLPFLIYYGGNGEKVSWNVEPFSELPVSGFLLVNYRGFGDSEGKPSAAAFRADAAFVFDELVRREGLAPGQIVLVGRSLGSGVAVDLAASREVAGLILVTPFDRLSSVASHHYPYLPVRALLHHRMDSVDLAPRITAPSLVVVAENDRTVPPRYGRRLYEALADPKRLDIIAGADHNDLTGHQEYWQALSGFLQTTRRPD